jgi:hypothetical protein
MKDDAKRVFFHELGHYVAHELGKRFYNGTGTKSIAIFPNVDDKDKFEGDARIVTTPNGEKRDALSIEKLPEILAAATYGCIFQAYFKNEDTFDDCFRENGMEDTKLWKDAMRNFRIDDFRNEILAEEKEFYKSLRDQKALEDFMKLDPDNFVTEHGTDNYYVNIDQLRKETEALVLNHHEKYKHLIEKYETFGKKHYKAP